jgi:hypothetical protein
MKSTKIMLAVIATLLSTWTSLSFICWMFSDLSFKACYTDGGILILMLLFGWIPAVIIACDLDKQLKHD